MGLGHVSINLGTGMMQRSDIAIYGASVRFRLRTTTAAVTTTKYGVEITAESMSNDKLSSAFHLHFRRV